MSAHTWIDEERIFNKKCAMIYEKLLDKLFPGYIDDYADRIVDWITNEWPENNLLNGWQKAEKITNKFLIPTLNRIRPFPAFIHAGAPTTVIECPHCHNKIRVPQPLDAVKRI